MSVAETEIATLAWLISALEHARTQGQMRLLMCLGAVVDDVLFEMASASRR